MKKYHYVFMDSPPRQMYINSRCRRQYTSTSEKLQLEYIHCTQDSEVFNEISTSFGNLIILYLYSDVCVCMCAPIEYDLAYNTG